MINNTKNIYISNIINAVYFYDRSVMFPLDDPKVISSEGISYITYLICSGVNEIEKLSHLLREKFEIQENIAQIEEAIIKKTIQNESIKEAFTSELSCANVSPKINGVFGMMYPEILHIEITGACNFCCSHCYKKATIKGKFVDLRLLEERIYKKLKGIVPVIHLTGGEPTIHKDFEEIVNMFKDDFELQLSTNGSCIDRFPISIFKNFSAIDISLYGLSNEEYKRNVGVDFIFDKIQKACEALSREKIEFRNTLVLNNENCFLLEEYIKFAIDVGAKSIAYSSTSNSGKLLETQNDKWIMTEETRKQVYILYREIWEKYKDKISIVKWERNAYSSIWKNNPSDGSLRCGGGKNSWWMTENFEFKPCTMLPDEYMKINYLTWLDMISGKSRIDWVKSKENLERFTSEKNMKITDICKIFQTVE